MTRYTVTVEAVQRTYDGQDAYGVLLRLERDGGDARPVHIVRSGPEIAGIALKAGPDREQGTARALQAVAVAAGEFIEDSLRRGGQALQSGPIVAIPYNEVQLAVVAGSDQELVSLTPGTVVRQFDIDE